MFSRVIGFVCQLIGRFPLHSIISIVLRRWIYFNQIVFNFFHSLIHWYNQLANVLLLYCIWTTADWVVLKARCTDLLRFSNQDMCHSASQIFAMNSCFAQETVDFFSQSVFITYFTHLQMEAIWRLSSLLSCALLVHRTRIYHRSRQKCGINFWLVDEGKIWNLDSG